MSFANKIHLGDCLEILKTLPDDSIDAIVSDPPYGLGTKEPTGEDIDRYLSGESRLDTGGDFMGHAWDIPSVAVFKECYRVLKPGRHILCFAGTRTWDLMAAGMRAAGFTHEGGIATPFGLPLLQWIHGQGFPKSLDIAKAIDKHLGVKREVLGERTVVQGGGTSLELRMGERREIQVQVTAPTSPEAKQWEGWGTALKPAWEPVISFRKPGPDAGFKSPRFPFRYVSKITASEADRELDAKDRLDGEESIAKNTHPCLHPDALVMTPGGYRPIKELDVGSLVLSADGLFHAVEVHTAHPYTSEALVDIRVLGTNLSCLASDNHPFMIWRPVRKGAAILCGLVQWLRADEIEKGDYTMTPIAAGGLSDCDPPNAADTEFWFLVGLYLAEGWDWPAGHGANVYPAFSLDQVEQDLIDRIRLYFSHVNVSVYQDASRGVKVLAFDPDAGALFRDLCGKGASTKQLHPCVWNLPEESLEALVEGYFTGDGGLVRTYLQAKSSSRDLASQMRFLGEMLGYKVEMQYCDPAPGEINGREFKVVLPYYCLRMSNRNRGLQERKPSKPTIVEHEGVSYLLSYVKSVARMPYVGEVHNLTVEGSHTFQTTVGMSHNTRKPLKIMDWLIGLVSARGEIVLDPFCGSGTTCVAAIWLGRQWVGCELDPKFHAIASERARVADEQTDARQQDRFRKALEDLDDDEPLPPRQVEEVAAPSVETRPTDPAPPPEPVQHSLFDLAMGDD
jgi:hypothetical protein